MSEHTETTTREGAAHVASQPGKLRPAEVDFIVRVLPVDNPLGLEALKHQRIYQVYKVLVDHYGQVVQVLGLMSSTGMDIRYIVN